MKASPLGINSALMRARMGISYLQSLHQWAQKNSSAGLPAGMVACSRGGRGFPSGCARLMFFLFQGGRAFSFQAEQIDVFLDSWAQGRGVVSLQLFLKISNGFGALAPYCENV